LPLCSSTKVIRGITNIPFPASLSSTGGGFGRFPLLTTLLLSSLASDIGDSPLDSKKKSKSEIFYKFVNEFLPR
jgi:hypothetical protein